MEQLTLFPEQILADLQKDNFRYTEREKEIGKWWIAICKARLQMAIKRSENTRSALSDR